MPLAISVQNVSKQYRLGETGTGSLAHDVNRWWHRIRGKEDPYLQVGATNDRTTKDDSVYAWALQKISFDVEQGEILGIIGRNGAGKSTLLKILSRITSPSIGSIKTKGRIASLLEVGTGFHPELTGRDNIYLNGAILGMRHREIKRKLDQIVEFSGCARYIDTPVKRYSSGMSVRLGFAVAAHLDCEILVVDEVLAVGDSEFQSKCIGRMKEVSASGRTVLFVSHNMTSVSQLCTSAIVMSSGCVVFKGNIETAITNYLNLNSQNETRKWERTTASSDLCPAWMTSAEIKVGERDGNVAITNGDDLQFSSQIYFSKKGMYSACIAVKREEQTAFISNTYHQNGLLEIQESGNYRLSVVVPKYLLNPGRHTASIYLADARGANEHIVAHEDILVFSVLDDDRRRGGVYSGGWPGAVSPVLDWKLE